MSIVIIFPSSRSIRIKSASLCGLGQTAPNPVLSTLRFFRDEYEAHIKEKRCPAHHCQALLNYVITDKCRGCKSCMKICLREMPPKTELSATHYSHCWLRQLEEFNKGGEQA